MSTDFAPWLKENMLLDHLDDLTYTVVTKKARLFRLDTHGLSSFKDIHEKLKQMAVIDAFLKKTLPDFQYKSKKAREKMVLSFEMKEFCQGVTLIKEGESMNYAYFIIDGEIKLLKKSANAAEKSISPKAGPVKKPPRLSELQQPIGTLTSKESSTY